MNLKIRLERIEGCMLSREYFDESMGRRDKSDLVISKLDEALRVIAEFQPRKTDTEPSRSSLEPRTPSLTEEDEDQLEKAVLRSRLRRALQGEASPIYPSCLPRFIPPPACTFGLPTSCEFTA